MSTNRYFKDWAPTAIVTLITGIALRLIYLDAPLASDELASISLWAQMPFSKIPSNYQYPNNHIFLNLILSVILKVFGVNHFLLRLPVLLFGILSLILGYKTTLKITGNKTIALGVLLLLTINTNHIYYSTNARGYIFIMVFAQLIFYLLMIFFQKGSNYSFAYPTNSFRKRDLFFLGFIWFFGTWTVPTFILFEISLLTFFGLSLILIFRKQVFNVNFPYTQITLILLLSLVGFYIQYYVFIQEKMLASALYTAASINVSQLIPGILEQWVYPFVKLRFIFLLAATIGLFSLFKKKKSLFYLLFCIILLPPGIVFTGGLTDIFPRVPPPRVFIYLQPFFFICTSLGAYLTIKKSYELVSCWLPNYSSTSRNIKFLYFLFFIPLFFYGGIELKNKTYPDRIKREPFHKVLQFVENLVASDLILTSNNTHVWFYLYGANEMRKRVNNIIDKGELGDIYFLEYVSNGESDIKRINKEGIDYFQFQDYSFIKKTRFEKQKALTIPAEIFQLTATFDNFKFHKIKPEYIQKIYELKDLKDINYWVLPNTKNLYLEHLNISSGDQTAIRFNDSFLIYSKKMNQVENNFFILNLNFISISSYWENIALYLNGKISGNQTVFNDTWLGNDWTLDHPYGKSRKIFKRTWRPAIFLSKPDQSVNIILAESKKPNSQSYIRGIQSYRIAFHLDERKTNK